MSKKSKCCKKYKKGKPCKNCPKLNKCVAGFQPATHLFNLGQ